MCRLTQTPAEQQVSAIDEDEFIHLPFPARALKLRLRGRDAPWGRWLPPDMRDSDGSPCDTCTSSEWSSPRSVEHLSLETDATCCTVQGAWRQPRGDEETNVVAVLGNVWSFSGHPQRCRIVQQAFDEASDTVRQTLASELHGHVWEAARCPNANHVLQRCVATVEPESLQFIIDEFMDRPGSAVIPAAKHRFSCRVILRLLEKCSSAQVRPMVDEFQESALQLCTHRYGHYAMQHVLEFGSLAQRRRLCVFLREHVQVLAGDVHGCAVLSKALAGDVDYLALARAVLAQPGLLVALACTSTGSATVQKLLAILPIGDRDNAGCQLCTKEDTLRSSRHGRLVLPLLPSLRFRRELCD